MEWLVILILTPIVFIVGLVESISWLSRGGKSAKQKLAEDLTNLAADPRYISSKEQYLEVAAYLKTGKPIIPNPALTPQYANNAQASTSTEVLPTAHTMYSAAPPVGGEAVTAPSHTELSSEMGDVFKTLDNINVLLYLGAFLIVASVGIFVGFNFTSIGGGAKTALVAALAILFYGAGLALYASVPKLRPAGSTFAAIGLVLTPLVGLAYFNFVLGAAGDAALVWLITSMISLSLYVLSFVVMRQQYIAYLGTISSLSLVESLIQTAHLPVYYMAWGLVITSILLVLVAHMRGGISEISRPLGQTSAVSAPLSAVVSLVLVGEQGIGQLGVTAILAAFYYLAMSVLSRVKDEVAVYYSLGLALIPVGLSFVLQDANQSRFVISLVLLVVGTTYCALGAIVRDRWIDLRPKITALLGGAILLGAALVVGDQPDHLSLVLAVAAVINVLIGLTSRYSYNLLLGILAALYLPIAVMVQLIPGASHTHISIAYLILAAGFVGLRAVTRPWEPDFRTVTRAGYILALALSFGFAVSAGPGTILAIGLIISAAAYGIGYLEGREEVNLAAGALLYVSVAQLIPLLNLDQSAYAYIFTLAGMVVYGFALADRRGATTMRLTGIAGPLVGAVAGGLFDQGNLSSVIGLVVGGSMVLAEGRRQSASVLAEIAGAVYVLAIAKLLWAASVTSTPVYADVAGAYFTWLAYRRHTQGEPAAKDTMTVLALAAITVPTALSSLTEGGQADGLILTVESVLIVLIGMAQNYRMVRQWGVYVLVGEVVYQSRTVIAALPWYVITALLGTALLGGAVWLLSRRSADSPH